MLRKRRVVSSAATWGRQGALFVRDVLPGSFVSAISRDNGDDHAHRFPIAEKVPYEARLRR